MYFCYILYSQKLDKFYKGSTKNIQDRVLKHNKGDVTFTATGRPWILMWYCTKPSRSEAIQLERKLKNLGRSRIIDFINKYSDQTPNKAAKELVKEL